MMAEVLGMSEQGLMRWQQRRAAPSCSTTAAPRRTGRPTLMPAETRQKIRECYVAHYRKWGPRVLAAWCRREGLGAWCASTIAEVIADLREAPEAKSAPTRYEIAATGVMWSEDGAGFKEHGRKRELLLAQDEHSRFKVNHALADGPATQDAVLAYLRGAFAEHGAPLVLKHDGGKIFHGQQMQELLARYQVLELTGPRHYPQYNGKQERSIRDVRTYERAMRRHGVKGTLRERLAETIRDLNEERPRPMLGGRTAREVFEQDRVTLPDRDALRKEVDHTETRMLEEARSRSEVDSARRRAVEHVLLAHGLMKELGDVSTDYVARSWTE